MSIRPDYNKKRAETIVFLKRKKKLSYNQIAKALDYAITPQRCQQIYRHYETRVEPEIKRSSKDFLSIFKR